MSCDNRLCPPCSRRRARQDRDRLRRYAASHPGPVLYARFSLTTHPNIVKGYDALLATRTEFLKHHTFSAWFSSIEVTRTPSGWHWHLNFLIWGHMGKPTELAARWTRAAGRCRAKAKSEEARSSFDVAAGAQYVELVRDFAAVSTYVTKGNMRPAKIGGNPTPGDLLRDAAVGDVDAAEGWDAVEDLATVRRLSWSSFGGGFRAKQSRRPARTPRPGRARLLTAADLARVDGLSTPTAAAQLGVSESTIKRARARARNAL